MLPLIAFWNGMERAAARWRLLVLYWFVHTLLALAIAAPVAAVATAPLLRSTLARELLGQFDVAWLAELYASAGQQAAPALLAAAAVAGLAAWLAGVLLAGGAVPALASPDLPQNAAVFWQNAGRNFWRFFRLSLYFLVLYASVFAALGLIRTAARALWGEGLAAAPLVYADWLRLALLLLAFGLLATASAFAKVRIVLSDSRQCLRACLGSVRLILRHPGLVFWLWACFAATGLAAAWLYLHASNWLETRLGALLLPLVALQQAYLLARILLRFALWGAAAEMDPLLRPLPSAAPPPPPAPPAPEYEI
ncbi:MAG: hypothetical protein N2036_10200 [Bryobacteraceae bacterium]|nr:hypothetical protein [Bryobacteraceae bacterium]MCX7604432.1 hypothetical protein [Bryobacteraceae bacterium]